MEQMIGWEFLLIQKQHISNGFDSESNLFTEQYKLMHSIKSHNLVLTYKVGSLGDVPSTKILIKGRGEMEHFSLAWENS
jgi:hypothetical protein